MKLTLKPWPGPNHSASDRPQGWLYPRILGHRGAGTLAPENTLGALRYAGDHGFQGVEVDAMLAADGVPVLMHDPIFGRTVKGSGSIASSSSLDLSRVDAGSWHSPAYAGEPVPTLEAAIALCRAAKVWMNIEIKPSSEQSARATGRTVGAITNTLYADVLGSPEAPVLSSFSLEALQGARETAPALVRGLLVEAIPSDWKQRMEQTGASTLHASIRHLTQVQVAAARDAAVPVMAYTVNSVDLAQQCFSWGVSAVCTDRLDLIDPDFV
ncbi:MAG: glycerophosphodiester phosphodiesterase [Burkholderiales bacterium]